MAFRRISGRSGPGRSFRLSLLAAVLGLAFLGVQIATLVSVGRAYSPLLLGDILCTSNHDPGGTLPESGKGTGWHDCCLLCQGVPHSTLPPPLLLHLPRGQGQRRRVLWQTFPCRRCRKTGRCHPPRAPPCMSVFSV